jgi:hypothetical protein
VQLLAVAAMTADGRAGPQMQRLLSEAHPGASSLGRAQFAMTAKSLLPNAAVRAMNVRAGIHVRPNADSVFIIPRVVAV